jgi:hypothetical protein
MDRTVITARIDGAAYEALRALSEREDRSVSWLVRKAVDRLLDGPGSPEKDGVGQIGQASQSGG